MSVLGAVRYFGAATIGRGRERTTTLCALVVVTGAVTVATPILAYLDHTLVRPSLVPHSKEVLLLQIVNARTGAESMLARSEVGALREQTGGFASVGSFAPGGSTSTSTLNYPDAVSWCYSDAGVFSVLRVPPLLGRVLGDRDGQGNEPAAVISFEFWTRAFKNNPNAIGQYLAADANRSYRIVGVMPAGFGFPVPAADAWIPFPEDHPGSSGMHLRRLVLRIPTGRSTDAVRARVHSILAGFGDGRGLRAELIPLDEAVSRAARLAAPLLAVGLVAALGLAAAIVWHLMLLDAMRRRLNIGIRLALGASRLRVFGLCVIRVVLLCAAGLVAGSVIAWYAGRSQALYGTRGAALMVQWVDLRVRTELLGMTALVATIAGAAPMLVLGGVDIRALLNSTSLGPPARTASIRGVLAAAQTGFATVFVICGSLTWLSVLNLNSVSPGFATDQLLTASVMFPDLLPRPLESVFRANETMERILGRSRAVPGISEAAATTNLPIYANGNRIPFEADRSRPECDSAEIRGVSARYFHTLGVPVVEGRTFAAADDADGLRVAVVNQTLARQCWPNQSAVGHVGGFGVERWKIIGVVGDVPMFGLRKSPVPELYVPMSQFALPFMRVILRLNRVDPHAVLPVFSRIVASVEPAARVSSGRTIEDMISSAEGPLTLRAVLLAHAAFCTVGVAVVGIYSTTAVASRSRRRDRAIRVALGATPRSLVWRDSVEAMAWSTPGIGIGAAVAYWAASSLAPVLFGVRPFEAWVYATCAALVVLLSGWAAAIGGSDISDPDLLRCLQSD